MHEGPQEGMATTPPSQDQADARCAFSEQRHSGQASEPFGAPVSSAVLGTGLVVPPAPPRLVLTDDWRTSIPSPSPPVQKHVLLSVFLI
jgi:hypothetical protein